MARFLENIVNLFRTAENLSLDRRGFLKLLVASAVISSSKKSSSQEINPEDYIPESVMKYEAHVKSQDYKKDPGDLSSIVSFYGNYLESTGIGYCDEFAFNALKHLRHAPDIEKLRLIRYKFNEADGCAIGHAILAYQTRTGFWRSISNGRDEGVAARGISKLIDQSVKLRKCKSGINLAYILDPTVLPDEIIESDNEIDEDELLYMLWPGHIEQYTPESGIVNFRNL